MKDIFYTVFKYKEKQSPDKLGLYPERVHTAAMPERRYLWSSRMLVIVASISISLNIVLAATFVLLLPQRSASPRLLHVNKDFYNLEQTQPVEKPALATDLLAENDIIDYIKLRYKVTQDYEENNQRWSEYSRFFWLSSPDVFTQFQKTEQEYASMQRQKGLTRRVEVEWVKPLTLGLWQAQFLTYDYFPNKKTVVNTWRANLRVTYKTLKYKTKDDMIKNPYGFVIDSYSLSYAGPKQ